MKCVILQPSYIPESGYFHQIYKSDLFIFYDDVQYDKEGWRNRSIIKTSQDANWLTIPIHEKGVLEENINIKDIEFCWHKHWNDHHWKGIRFAYNKAPHFNKFRKFFKSQYQKHPRLLADLTIETCIQIVELLGISHVKYKRSSKIRGIEVGKTDRITHILKIVGATHYISVPSARNYLEEDKFRKNDIQLEYMVYKYPECSQLYPPFVLQVSIVDHIFMTGEDGLSYII